MAERRSVAIVGATGIAGQQFVAALAEHPWFAVTRLVASARSAGKTYAEALRDPKTGARRWWCSEEPPERLLSLGVEEGEDFDPAGVDLVFSAVEADVARELEPRCARTTPVVSTASAFRYEDDVPILVPGVNSDHARLLELQRRRRGWKGFVTPIPNCTATGLVLALKPVHDVFGIRRVLLVSMQGISGAGRSPGVIGLDILDNVIPFIPNEEEKVARETGKIFGTLGEGGIRPATFAVSATCTRAAVLEGHTEAVFVSTEKPATPAAVAEAMRAFSGGDSLPSAPKRWIVVHDDPFRPQPRLDRDAEDGMATSVGRIRPDAALENGIKFVLVSHNTKMGAAKGAVLVAEDLVTRGLI
ncbi:MAG: aspartate-semialdehyde dehydrogenase [Candidatus Binatota bacterium]|jgi:aspartate-semialdehyde dehydrogenase|nr:aspartate-semialdehyde dehydrogenase [Candidatus Binatota bacterium]